MPNWTFNQIRIMGEKAHLDKFMADAIRHENYDSGFSLSSWLPIPETFLKYDTTNHPNGQGLRIGEKWRDGLGDHGDEVVTEELIEEFKKATKEQREKYGVVGWYDYNHKVFGCKWDSEVIVDSVDDDEINLSADTPWCAPEAWLRTLSKNYPELVFNLHAIYEEGFWEETEYKGGRKSEVDSGGYDWDEEETDMADE